jgi:ABC-type Fe3+ transport system substrate-binding protein
MRWARFPQDARERDILLTLGNEAAIASVVSASGRSAGASAATAPSRPRPKARRSRLIVWEEGLALAQFIGVVPAKAPHPNAARLLLRWMMTPEGQELLVKNVNQYSARKDVTITPLSQPPLSALKINAF